MAITSLMYLTFPLISLKTTTPQSDATMEGPDVMIGNATVNDRFLLARNQEICAKAQIIPLRKPGRATSLYTAGLFLEIMQ